MVNELYPLVMSWLIDANLNANAVHARLVEDHFADEQKPSRATIYNVWAGRSRLSCRLVLAFAEISSADSEAEEDRLKDADDLLTELEGSPTTVPLSTPLPSPSAGLKALEAKVAHLEHVNALQRAETRSHTVIYTAREALRAAEQAIFRLQSYVRVQSDLFDQFAGVIDQEGRRPAAVEAISPAGAGGAADDQRDARSRGV